MFLRCHFGSRRLGSTCCTQVCFSKSPWRCLPLKACHSVCGTWHLVSATLESPFEALPALGWVRLQVALSPPVMVSREYSLA